MNIPNKLTVMRLILAPIFFIVFSSFGFLGIYIQLSLLTIIWAVIEVSDLADGFIARKYNLITDVGKVLDPFSDSFAHLTFFLCFLIVGFMPAWAFLIILYREMLILLLRMLMMRAGTAVAANVFGKMKSLFYAISTLASIVWLWYGNLAQNPNATLFLQILSILFSISAILALLSLIIYSNKIFSSKALKGLSK